MPVDFDAVIDYYIIVERLNTAKELITMDNEFEDNGFGENVVPIDDLLFVKYVVISLNGQNGD